jgi:hypothetical protein
MSDPTPLVNKPVEVPATRTVRTYKTREKAELAVEKLKAAGIEASILELAAPPGRAALVSEAVRLVVDEEHAKAAAKLLLQHAADLIPGADPRRNKPRVKPRVSAGMPWLFILLALGGAAGAIFYYIWSATQPKEPRGTGERARERHHFEDMNQDGKTDLRRYLAASGAVIREELDLNFDEKWDLLTHYDQGRPKRRTRDLDQNGVYDEDLFYDLKGRPFYSQLMMNGKSPVTKRTFYQTSMDFEDWEPTEADPGVADDPKSLAEVFFRPFRVLTDADADGHFDLDQQFNLKGEVISERKLEKGAVENNPPAFPK